MRIGIDTHAAERDASGNCTYVRGIVEALLALVGGDDRLFLYALDSGHRWYDRIRSHRSVSVRELRPAAAVGRLAMAMPLASWRDRLDVLHVQYVGPLLHRGALVVTVHDVAYETHGSTFPPLLRARLRWQVPRQLRKASEILTVSQASAAELVRAYSVAADRITVVPNGVDARFARADRQQARERLAASGIVRTPFVLSVGRLNARKNLEGLLAAYELLRSRRAEPIALVLAGGDDHGADSLRAAVARSPFAADVVLAGPVDDETLAALYAAADVFAYPSFYEGFGLPPLEAMASGTPVVASCSGGLAEVLGDAAVIVDPHRPESIADGLARVLEEPGLAAALRERGRAQAARFSWQNAAATTLQAYERAAQQARR